MAYNVSGDRGVQLELMNGVRILIGSERAGELAEAIGEQMKRERLRRQEGTLSVCTHESQHL